MELIELRELQPEPRPGRGRLERTNALRISPARRHGPGARPEPRPAAAPSTGHRFEPRRRGLHTWCDLCGDFVWGGGRKSLQCRHCSFTCHYRCRALVRLDCSGPPGTGDEDDGSEQELEKDTNVDEPSSWETAELDPAQVEQRIKEYNSQINSNLFMSLNKDGSYTGFIKVQLKLARPVSVPAAKRGPGGRSGQRTAGVKRRTSFYLPRGTVKHLHVLSHTRASEVISALLRKFTVVDDPRKFALFERSEKDEQVYLRKLADEEQPLRLRLLAGPSEKALSFVLKENESGEVNWDAFSLPELHNFLRILQREEDEQLRRVRHRYARCRRELQAALAAHTPG
ncbi:ras association domain-containing protein 1 isoform X1 [Tympanuchus pallidicinctus]|uniref:ras association domain-containing protein 1 isoform X1 n=1 Tax=Tympanuchus pallidicinctus TaxID=109042 RepID=UPI0022874B48|nr:ras association domain-containing protein 1 isoform X1 [Tympanuchus pallidicinctus]